MKTRISAAICAFFVCWTLLVSAYLIYRTGLDDKTIMLAYSQCFFSPQDYQKVTSRMPPTRSLCKAEKNCEWRTSERFLSAYNYPFINTVMHLVRELLPDKNGCRSMSLSIYWAYAISTLLILALFLSCIFFLFDSDAKWFYLASFAPLVFLHPFFNHTLTALSSYGFPHVEELTYLLGPFPRSHLAMTFLIALPLIVNARYMALAGIVLLNIFIHMGQGTLANISILGILLVHLFTQNSSKKLYLLGTVLFLMNIIFLLFAKSNYQATDFRVDLSSVLPALLQTKTALLMLGWALIGLAAKNFMKADPRFKFYYICTSIILCSMTFLRTYNLSLRSAHEETTTLLIIADRFDATVAIALYFSVILSAFYFLRRFVNQNFLKFSYIFLGIVIAFTNWNRWLDFSKEIAFLIPSYIDRAQTEICSSQVTLPKENIVQSLSSGTLSPTEEVLLHLKIDRTCQGL